MNRRYAVAAAVVLALFAAVSARQFWRDRARPQPAPAPVVDARLVNERVAEVVETLGLLTERDLGGDAGHGAGAGAGSWSLVCRWPAPTSQARAIETLDGVLYVSTGGNDGGLGLGRVWRITDEGCTDVTPWGDTADRVPGMLVAGGWLYAGMGSFSDGGELWRSRDGSSWERVHTFPAPIRWPGVIARFGDRVCVGVDVPGGGAGVYCDGGGGWSRVLHLPDTSVTYSMHVSGRTLYLGTAYPAEIYRTDDLATWQRVADFPAGGVSHVEDLQVFDKQLFAGLGRLPWKDRDSRTVVSLAGATARPVAGQPADWLLAHNFNALTVFGGELVVSMGSLFNRMSVWSRSSTDGSWRALGGRQFGDWGGGRAASPQLRGEWIYDLHEHDGALYASVAGEAGAGALWRFVPTAR